MLWPNSSLGGSGAGVSSVAGKAVAVCRGTRRSGEGCWGAGGPALAFPVYAIITGCCCTALISARQHGSRGTCFLSLGHFHLATLTSSFPGTGEGLWQERVVGKSGVHLHLPGMVLPTCDTCRRRRLGQGRVYAQELSNNWKATRGSTLLPSLSTPAIQKPPPNPNTCNICKRCKERKIRAASEERGQSFRRGCRFLGGPVTAQLGARLLGPLGVLLPVPGPRHPGTWGNHRHSVSLLTSHRVPEIVHF